MKAILRAGPIAGLFAVLAGLSGCSQLGFEEFSQDTEPPALNLATGCFSTINPTGKTYIFTGCLTKDELVSFREQSNSAPLRETVKRALSAYQASLKPYPHRAGEPMLNLTTGCIVPSDDKDRAYEGIPCLSDLPVFGEDVLPPAVQRKIEAVRKAHLGAIQAVNALPRISPSDGFAAHTS